MTTGVWFPVVILSATALSVLSANPNSLTPTITAFATTIGVEMIGGLIDRIARGEEISEDEIRDIVTEAINQTDIANLLTDILTKEDFEATIAKLAGGHSIGSIYRRILDDLRRITSELHLLTETQRKLCSVLVELQDFRPHVDGLRDKITSYLKVHVSFPIDLSMHNISDAVPSWAFQENMMNRFFRGQEIPADKESRYFTSFSEAVNDYGGRVLLLGEPGAGKTITLFNYGLEAIDHYLANPDAPIPFVVQISAWLDYGKPSIGDLITTVDPDLKDVEINQIIDSGRALLLLDGLDELGSQERTMENGKLSIIDPRPEFVKIIPENNRIVLTCRQEDYFKIGEQVQLTGAVTLEPLSENQIENYLSHYPELLKVVEETPNLLQLLSVLLMLSCFTEAYVENGMLAQNLQDLDTSSNDLRDEIFRRLVEKRYRHEERKSASSLPYSLETIHEELGFLAMMQILYGRGENEIEIDLSYDDGRLFVEQMEHLNLISTPRKSYLQFSHLLLRDYFCFNFCINGLVNGDEEIRRNTATVLGRLGDKRAITILISALEDQDETTQVYARSSLARLVTMSNEIELLIAVLKSKNAAVRSHVSTVFRELKTEDRSMIEPLIDCLEDENPTVRRNVVIALGKLKDKRAVAPLILALKDTDPDVRTRVVLSLNQLEDKRAIEPLIVAATDNHERVRCEAMAALAEFQEPRVVGIALEALNDTSEAIRRSAAGVLGNLRDPSTVNILIEALKDDSPSVRSVVVRALCNSMSWKDEEQQYQLCAIQILWCHKTQQTFSRTGRSENCK